MKNATCSQQACTAPPCHRPVVAKGLCMNHYKSMRRWGALQRPTCRGGFCDSGVSVPHADRCKFHERHADQLHMGPDHMPGSIRSIDLLALMISVDTDDCMEWPRAINAVTGYGSVSARGGNQTTHREALILSGDSPTADANWALHSCNNRPCVNVKHLRWGTPAENVQDRTRDGVWAEAMANRQDWIDKTPLSDLLLWLANGWGRGKFVMLSAATGLSEAECRRKYKRATS